jgi:hypothetical protein
MTTFAMPDTGRRLAELDARTRVAWTTYRDDLADLVGAAYVDAEAAAWDELQAALRVVEAERAEIVAPQKA